MSQGQFNPYRTCNMCNMQVPSITEVEAKLPKKNQKLTFHFQNNTSLSTLGHPHGSGLCGSSLVFLDLLVLCMCVLFHNGTGSNPHVAALAPIPPIHLVNVASGVSLA